jgi:DNA-binding winged helix-turn-helix (wHTH) protein
VLDPALWARSLSEERSMNQLQNERYVFADFTLDLVAGRLFVQGDEVYLRPKSFAMLLYLVRNAGRVVSKDELMSAVWPVVTVTEDSLTQCVRDVRRVLGDVEMQMLRNVPRRGYVLNVEVQTPRDNPLKGLTSLDTPVSASREHAASDTPPILALRVVQRERPLSLAILRFVNQTGDPEREFIAAGIPVNIALILGSSPLLRYTEWWRNLTAAQRGGVRGIAVDLNVDLVLDGSIGLASPGYRFLGTLHDGPSGGIVATIQAEVLDGDLARLQYLIAKSVVDAVAELTGSRGMATLDPDWGATSAQPDEFTFFLRSQAAVNASNFSGGDDGLRLIEPALARYPQSVPLRLLKADILVNRAYSGPPGESWHHAQTAWTILSEVPDASRLPLLERWSYHYVRASAARLATGDFEAGMRSATEALRLVPNAMTEKVTLASVAAEAGFGATAAEWVRATMREKPRPVDWQRDVLASALLADGRPEEALAEYAQIQRYSLPGKVVALVRTGRLEQARNLVATIRRERPDITIDRERSWPTGRHPMLPEPFLSRFLDDLREAGLPETGPLN